MTLTLRSPVFLPGGMIPRLYTCDGSDISPPLSWSGVPHGTQSLALIVDDPDAPDPAAPKMVYVHWVLFNLPPSSQGLRENVGSSLPEGTEEGRNDWQRTGYGGPCPPIGQHRYFFKLYALDQRLMFKAPPTKAHLEAAMVGHILQQAELIGTYHHGDP